MYYVTYQAAVTDEQRNVLTKLFGSKELVKSFTFKDAAEEFCKRISTKYAITTGGLTIESEEQYKHRVTKAEEDDDDDADETVASRFRKAAKIPMSTSKIFPAMGTSYTENEMVIRELTKMLETGVDITASEARKELRELHASFAGSIGQSGNPMLIRIIELKREILENAIATNK